MVKTNNKHSTIKTIITISFLAVLLIIIVLCLKKAEEYYIKSSYPLMYQEEIKKYSDKYNVDKALIYGIIKTESNFKENAVSPAGAIGLMQIMPSTLEWLVTYYTDDNLEELNLYDVETNIKYGTLYLSILLKRYESQSAVICAYNAGIGNVDSWLNNNEYSDGVNITNIPFTETRNYLDRVLTTESMYNTLYFQPKSTNGG